MLGDKTYWLSFFGLLALHFIESNITLNVTFV